MNTVMEWHNIDLLIEYSSPPLIGTQLLANMSVLLERCPLVRGRITCIHSTFGQEFVSFLEGVSSAESVL